MNVGSSCRALTSRVQGAASGAGLSRCASPTNRELVWFFLLLQPSTHCTCDMWLKHPLFTWTEQCTCISCGRKSLLQHKGTVSPIHVLPLQMSRPLCQRELDGLEARQKRSLHGVWKNSHNWQQSNKCVFCFFSYKNRTYSVCISAVEIELSCLVIITCLCACLWMCLWVQAGERLGNQLPQENNTTCCSLI